MTCAPPIADAADSAVDRAQLHLALASVSYMSGQAARSRAEAEAVLAEPGLPAALYAAAEQSRLLALLADGSTPAIEHPGTPAALVARAALAWRDGCVGETLEMLSAAACAEEGGQRQGCYPSLGLAMVYAALGQFDDAQACVLAAADEIALGADPLWAAAPAVFSARVDLAAGRLDAARTVGAVRRGDRRRARHADARSDRARRARGGRAVPRRVGRGRSRARTVAGRAPRRPIAVRHAQPPLGGPTAARGARSIRCSATKRAATRSTCSPPTGRCSWSNRPRPPGWSAPRVAPATTGVSARSRAPPSAWPPPTLATPPSPRQLPTPAGSQTATPRSSPRQRKVSASPWARASAAEDCAVVQAQRGDRAAARSWLERAAEDYLRCGATRDHARIRSRLRHLGVRRRHWSRQQRPVSGWDSLTETEHAVAALVAEGLSNQQVASRMFLSRHTVDFHLRHIFRKLGIDSRVVLTRIALAQRGATVMRCAHVDWIRAVTPSSWGCQDCLAAGRRDWVHLRVCQTCGHVGCCDSSPGRHATRHFVDHDSPDRALVRAGRGLVLVLRRPGRLRARRRAAGGCSPMTVTTRPRDVPASGGRERAEGAGAHHQLTREPQGGSHREG